MKIRKPKGVSQDQPQLCLPLTLASPMAVPDRLHARIRTLSAALAHIRDNSTDPAAALTAGRALSSAYEERTDR